MHQCTPPHLQLGTSAPHQTRLSWRTAAGCAAVAGLLWMATSCVPAGDTQADETPTHCELCVVDAQWVALPQDGLPYSDDDLPDLGERLQLLLTLQNNSETSLAHPVFAVTPVGDCMTVESVPQPLGPDLEPGATTVAPLVTVLVGEDCRGLRAADLAVSIEHDDGRVADKVRVDLVRQDATLLRYIGQEIIECPYSSQGDCERDADVGEQIQVEAQFSNRGSEPFGPANCRAVSASSCVVIRSDLTPAGSYFFATGANTEQCFFRVELTEECRGTIVSVQLRVEEEEGERRVFEQSVPIWVHPGQDAELALESLAWTDDIYGQESDDLVQPGDQIRVSFDISNPGPEALRRVSAALVDAGPCAIFEDVSTGNTDWLRVGERTRFAPWRPLTVDPACQATELRFVARITDVTDTIWDFPITIPIVQLP